MDQKTNKNNFTTSYKHKHSFINLSTLLLADNIPPTKLKIPNNWIKILLQHTLPNTNKFIKIHSTPVVIPLWV